MSSSEPLDAGPLDLWTPGPQNRSVPPAFVLGEWTVTPARNLLARGADEIRVEPRVMDVLVCLAEHPGDVVSKEQLIARVWDGRYVTDDVLTVTIYGLRKVLGDDARQPRYIETVPRRGYRLVADLKKTNRDSLPVRKESRSLLAAAAALVLLAGISVWTVGLARPARHVPSAESHEAYVKGRYFLDQRSVKGWQQALDEFRRAVALDPNDPAAHAGLADAYSAMADFGIASPAELRPRAMEAAARALELDARSAEGLEALGRAEFLFDWDFASAERHLARAIARDPSHMPAHQAMAWLKSAQGEFTDAAASARRALQLDPVNAARYTELAWILALAGHHDAAVHEVERTLLINPRAFEPYIMKGWIHEQAGRPDAAIAAYREAWRVSGAPDATIQRVDAVYRTEGLPGYYRSYLRGLSEGSGRSASGSTPVSDTWRAKLYLEIGELDRALESLERAFENREGALAWVNVEPAYQPLRSNARFQHIAASVARPK
jgi:DNA-binding winged helix-turn-helix (wHTH) protein/Flp pilus assembly protein TadD